mmetsp:Transcript_52721/g.163774  ORF Transcript_52721/g.163774 Transcript_52721/m.163774 type:complete len:305 (+) Transcript_52721:674-1588(+)
MESTHRRRAAACFCCSCACFSCWTFSSMSASSSRPMLRRYFTSSTSSSNLQVGQVCLRASQRRRQFSWKPWPQGSSTTGAPASVISSAQMTQTLQPAGRLPAARGCPFSRETSASHAGSGGTSQSSPSWPPVAACTEAAEPGDSRRATTLGNTRNSSPPSSGRCTATTVTDSTRMAEGAGGGVAAAAAAAAAVAAEFDVSPGGRAALGKEGDEVTGSLASVTSTPSVAPQLPQTRLSVSLPQAVRAPQWWQKRRPSAAEAPAPMSPAQGPYGEVQQPAFASATRTYQRAPPTLGSGEEWTGGGS